MTDDAGATDDHGPMNHVVVLRRAKPYLRHLRVGTDTVRWRGDDANYQVHFSPCGKFVYSVISMGRDGPAVIGEGR
jgi:hypothetical protein